MQLLSCSALCLALVPMALASKGWPSQSFHTEPFSMPNFEITRSATEQTVPGALFLGITSTTHKYKGTMIASDDGELIWHGNAGNTAIYNFHSQTWNNKTVLSYWRGTAYGSHGYGSVTVLNDDYTHKADICLPEAVNNDIVTPVPYHPGKCFIDKHESYISDRNTLIVTTYNVTQADLREFGGTRHGWVFDALFFELDLNDNNKVLFRWSALEAGVKLSSSHYVNTTGPEALRFGDHRQVGDSKADAWDFFHINSVQPIPGGYLVNSRMTWSFYVVDGTTGNINYTVEGSTGGDFKFTNDIYFSWEHNPRLVNTIGDTDYITLFNNDEIGMSFLPYTNHSSAYYLAVNKTAKTVTSIDFFQDPKNLLYAFAEGSCQSLAQGHFLVGYGDQPFIQEFDQNANPIYTAQFYSKKYGGLHTYRAYRLPWSAQPAAPPKTVASARKGQVVAYMSWNGATTYTAWNVLCDKSSHPTTVVGKNITKSGFETSYKFQADRSKCRNLLVQALDSNGNVLASSKVVKVK